MKGPKALTIVIKLGTSSIVNETTYEPLLPNLTTIVETVVRLRKDGHKVIIVSSGAIGVGLSKLGISKRPKHLSKLQAIAAIGQCRLISLWDSLFAKLGQPIGQLLLTRNDIADRTQYLNAQNTFASLLEMGVIPIVNENDTIAVTEIKFGDNDTLSAITAAMVHADYLFLMTDVDCLYDRNPRTHPDARPVEVVEDIAALTADVSQMGSKLGTGGMSTKIVAARLATSAGVSTVITRSSAPQNIIAIVRYIQSLKPSPSPSTSRSQSRTSSPASPADKRLSNPPPLSITSDPFSNHHTNHNRNCSPKSDSLPAFSLSTSLAQKLENGQHATAALKINRPPTPLADVSHTSSPINPPSTADTSAATSYIPSSLNLPSLSSSSLSAFDDLDLTAIPKHTRFIASPHPVRDRYFWLLFGLAPHGTIYIDAGAHRALTAKAGLLPVGIVDVEGNFAQQEAVRLVVVERLSWEKTRNHNTGSITEGLTRSRGVSGSDNSLATPASLPNGIYRSITHDSSTASAPSLTFGAVGLDGGVSGSPTTSTAAAVRARSASTAGKGLEVGRALVNYSATEIARIKGVRSSEIEGLLGYADSEYVALRENISFFEMGQGPGNGAGGSASRPVTPANGR